MSNIKRFAALLTFLAVWGITYTVAPLVALSAPTYFAWDPVFDMPILTGFVLFYLSFWGIPIAAFLAVREEADLWSLMRCLCGMALLSALIYVLWPTAIVRPAFSAEWHFGGWLLKLVHETDTNGNCLPSEHVSISAFCAFALGRFRPRWRWVWWGWAALVVLSTVFTRQHYVLDVAGGLLVAAIGALAFLYDRR